MSNTIKLILIILAIVVGVALLALLIYWIVKKIISKKKKPTVKKKKPENKEPEGEKIKRSFWSKVFFIHRDVSVSAIFKQNIKKLKSTLTYFTDLYDLPFFLLLGTNDSGKSSLMQSAKREYPFGIPDEEERGGACQFWITDKGVVVEVKGHDTLNVTRSLGAYQEVFIAIVKQLKFYRRRRVVDGIILTISYSDLLNLNKADLITAQSKVEKELRYQVQYLKKMSKMHLPIYVVVTHADKICGFTNVTESLPKAALTNMFGWSSSRPVGEIYDQALVDQAFKYLRNAVRKLQFEIFSKRSNIEHASDIMYFEQELVQISAPLRDYITAILRPDIYSDKAFSLRGIYFVGNTPGETAGGDKLVNQVFVRDLIAEKIFIEASIARPIADVRTSGKKKVFSARNMIYVIAALVPIGWWLGSRVLQKKVDTLSPVLGEAIKYIDVNSLLRQKANIIPENQLGHRAWQQEWQSMQPVLKMLLAYEGSLRTIYLPYSWISTLNSKIEEPLHVAALNLLLRSIYTSLNYKVGYLLQSGKKSYPATLTAKNLPNYLKFSSLNDFVTQSTQLEKVSNSFDQLDIKYSKNEFTSLVRYTLGDDAATMIQQESSRAIKKLLNSLSPGKINIYQYSARFNNQLRQMATGQSEYLLKNWPLEVGINQINAALSNYKHGSITFRGLMQILTDINTLNVILINAQKEKASGVASGIESGLYNYTWGGFNKALNLAIQSNLFSAEMINKIQKTVNTKFKSHVDYASKLTNPDFGQILSYNRKNDSLSLSPRFLSLMKALTLVKGYNFQMVPFGARVRSLPQAPGFFTWNRKVLADSATLITRFDSFKKYAGMQKNKGIAYLATQLASQASDYELLIMVSNSFLIQTPGDASNDIMGTSDFSASEVKSLTDNKKQILNISAATSKNAFVKAHDRLSKLVDIQTMNIINAASSHLTDDNLYMPLDNSFSWWNGEAGDLAYRAYDVQGAKALNYYLKLQRDRIQYISSTYALPSLNIRKAINKSDGASGSRMIQKWTEIAASLDAYKKKKPTNSLSMLENFIDKDMGAIDVTNCNVKLKKLVTPTDYFSLTQYAIQKMILKRCNSLAKTQSITSYDKVVDGFNRYLAGWFPFVNSEDLSTAPGIEYGTLVDYYASYINDLQASQKLFKAIKNPGMKDKVRLKFINDLMDSFGFLLINQNNSFQTPAYNFKVYFRVNKQNESGGNQIALWSFVAGDKTLTPADKKNQGSWAANDETSLSLNWATDSPILPQQSESDPNMSVDGKDLAYTYNKQWSLLRMILTHKTDMAAGSKKPYNILLGFKTKVANANNPDAKSLAKINPNVQVFIGLMLLDAAKAKPLALPNFPSAPPNFYNTQKPYNYVAPPPAKVYSRASKPSARRAPSKKPPYDPSRGPEKYTAPPPTKYTAAPPRPSAQYKRAAKGGNYPVTYDKKKKVSNRSRVPYPTKTRETYNQMREKYTAPPPPWYNSRTKTTPPKLTQKPQPKPKRKPISQPTQKAPGPEPTNDGGGYISVPVPWYNDSAKKDIDTNNKSQGNSSNPGANSKPSNNPPASQEQISTVPVKPVAHKKKRARAVLTERVAITQQKKKTPPWQKQIHTTAKKQPYGRSVLPAKKKSQRSVSSAPSWYVRAQIAAPSTTVSAKKVQGSRDHASLPAPTHNSARRAVLAAPTASIPKKKNLSIPSDTGQTSYNGKKTASLSSVIPAPTADQVESASAIGIPAPNTHVAYQSMIPPPNRQ